MRGHIQSRRCLVAVSSHGLGHLAQISPVVNATTQLAAELELDPILWTARTTIKPEHVHARLGPHIEIDPGSDDFGMVMHDAINTDLVASLRRYAALHSAWDQHVTVLAQHLQSQNIQAVLADVPYLTLAAAAQAGIPSLAICSLNWSDILRQCVADAPLALTEAGLSTTQFETILTQINDAYQQASCFLRPEPSMDMPSIPRAIPIGPVCEPPAPAQRAQLNAWVQQQFQCPTPNWLVLVSMGGIPTQLNMRDWPTHCLGKPIYYIVAGTQTAQTPHSLPAQACAFDYATLFASCDLVITKPGYGTFVEAASLAKPLIYLQRPGWPESAALTTWLDRRGHARAIAAAQITPATLADAMADLLSHSVDNRAVNRLSPHGNYEAARHFLQILEAQ